MALQILETWESGEGSIGHESSDEYSALVMGDPTADNADDAATVMLFACPKFSIVSSLGNILNTFSRKRVAPGTWVVTGHYKSPTDNRQTNDASFSFTVGSGSQHITHSLQTIQGYSATSGQKPPNYQGAIGVDQDGKVAGTDIDVTTFDFTTTFYPPPSKITGSYVQMLKSLRGCQNSDTVNILVDGVQLGFQPGELRFLHANGSKRRGFGDWEFSLNWSAIANVSNQKIGPITGISKNGWDYLWVLYQQQADTTANARLPKPIAAYVEQIYTPAALTPLLLSTSFGLANAQPWTSPTPQSGTGVTSG